MSVKVNRMAQLGKIEVILYEDVLVNDIVKFMEKIQRTFSFRGKLLMLSSSRSGLRDLGREASGNVCYHCL